MQFPGNKVHLRKTVEWNSWIACTFICGQCSKRMFKKKMSHQSQTVALAANRNTNIYAYSIVSISNCPPRSFRTSGDWQLGVHHARHTPRRKHFVCCHQTARTTEIFGWEEYQHMVQVPRFLLHYVTMPDRCQACCSANVASYIQDNEATCEMEWGTYLTGSNTTITWGQKMTLLSDHHVFSFWASLETFFSQS